MVLGTGLGQQGISLRLCPAKQRKPLGRLIPGNQVSVLRQSLSHPSAPSNMVRLDIRVTEGGEREDQAGVCSGRAFANSESHGSAFLRASRGSLSLATQTLHHLLMLKCQVGIPTLDPKALYICLSLLTFQLHLA